MNAQTINLYTRNTLFSRILDRKRLSFELVEFKFNSKAREKLKNIKCENGDSMPQYLMKFTQCQDELGSVGVTVR